MKTFANLVIILLVTAAALEAGPASAQNTVGRVTHLAGTLSVVRLGAAPRLLAINSPVLEGDILSTEKDTYARVKFSDDAEVVLRPESQLRIAQYHFDATEPSKDNMVFAMLKGGLRAVTGLIGKRNRDRVGVTTPTATVGIRGTHFGLLECPPGACAGLRNSAGRPLENGLHIDVANGMIYVTNNAGTVELSAGQFGFVANPAALPQIRPPDAAIRVALNAAVNGTSGRTLGGGQGAACTAN
jgi:hypothetical protein